ncbi:MAG TPA: hypothetical protein VLG37_01230 [Candidatus Saccharimonadales bacterium]|nr:hypothetical protein [Candidatus Saccharimonadales bacterium]
MPEISGIVAGDDWRVRPKVDGIAIDVPRARRLDDAVWAEREVEGYRLRVSVVDLPALEGSVKRSARSWILGRELPVLSAAIV